MKVYIQRDDIINRLKPFIGKSIIKILSGQRRVGKSYILHQLRDELKSENIIYINKELYEFEFIKDYQDLINYVDQENSAKNAVLFLDEIQDIQEFEKALRHFQAKETYDIYCTGSNAKLLSGELATYLSGRYVEFTVNSLSYTEFKKFHKPIDVTIEEYIKFGGMPYLKNLALSDEVAFQYLKTVYESIILKDVVERYNYRNSKFLENLVYFLAENIGSVTSAQTIANFLKSTRINMTVATVINYLDALKNCFFIHEAKRFDIKGKHIFEINSKYYFEDIGLRNAVIGYQKLRDIGKIMENLVYMKLLRDGYKVFVGVIGNKEVDFVATKGQETVYVQVAYRIDSESTLQREISNLLEIRDNFEKILITFAGGEGESIQGIKHLGLEEFLQKTKLNWKHSIFIVYVENW